MSPNMGKTLGLTVLSVLTMSAACSSPTTPSDASADSRPDVAMADSEVDAAPDAASDGSSEASVDATTDATTDGGVDSGVDTGADSGVDSGSDSGVDARADAVTDGGAVRISIRDFMSFSNCMPIVPPDPVRANWTVDVSGASGSTARITSATLSIRATGSSVVQTLVVSPTTFPLVGGAGSAMIRKESGNPAPTGSCRELCSGDSTLTLEIDVGAGPQRVMGSTMHGCAF
jgi:hypothetical protein